jgi:hypothetical protein
VNVKCSGDVELLVIGSVGAFDMGILLAVALVVLNESAAKAFEELSKLGDLAPGASAEFLSMIYSEDDLGLHAVGS